MIPRFVLPASTGPEIEFSIRKEAAPRKEIATVVLAAPDFTQAMWKALRWSEKYTERKLSGNDRAFPAVKYSGELYLVKKYDGNDPVEKRYVFIENNERASWVSPRMLEVAK